MLSETGGKDSVFLSIYSKKKKKKENIKRPRPSHQYSRKAFVMKAFIVFRCSTGETSQAGGMAHVHTHRHTNTQIVCIFWGSPNSGRTVVSLPQTHHERSRAVSRLFREARVMLGDRRGTETHPGVSIRYKMELKRN